MRVSWSERKLAIWTFKDISHLCGFRRKKQSSCFFPTFCEPTIQEMQPQTANTSRPFSGYIWPCLLVAVTIWFLGNWFRLRETGFEFTDEGFYMLLTRDPWLHPVGTFFGFIFHPFFLFAGCDLGRWRVFGLGILGLAGMLAFQAWWAAQKRTEAVHLLRWPMAALFISGAWLVFSDGQRTPCYNYLVVLGAILAWASYFWLEAKSAGTPWAWIVMACGFFLVLAGKWSALPGLALLMGCLLWIRDKWTWRNLLIFGGTLLALTICLGFYMGATSIEQSILAIRLFVAEGKAQKVDYWSWYGVTLANFFYRVLRAFLYGLPLLVLLGFMLRRRPGFLNRRPDFTWLLPWILLLGGLFFGLSRGGASFFSRVGSNVLAEVCWVAVGACLWLKVPPGQLLRRLGWPSLALLLTPFALGMGTLVSLGDWVGQAALFFQIIGLNLWMLMQREGLPIRTIAALVSVSALFNFFRLDASLRDQFRIGSLANSIVPCVVSDKQKVFLDPARAHALGEIRASLSQLDFHSGDPLIAIGDIPGVVYLVGGWSPGTAWYMASSIRQKKYLLQQITNLPEDTRSRAFFLMRLSSPISASQAEFLALLQRSEAVGSRIEGIDLEGDKQGLKLWGPVNMTQHEKIKTNNK